ncbi:hypothetical protein SUGI_1058300 [Cryptomeria japonica]|uniref:nucleobase-ascorbate transporter 12 isoform X2 n=1 Tax=Cryptomeria japonica TaxID=3369 RepID=UPI0024146D36|nr:nucleobase-ascorbate transporter 12 isoform X2 [Cryptomeria japonica]GLJ49818.1 hypothetical protein SUGI_1058300 [Cryptomeria japonica]
MFAAGRTGGGGGGRMPGSPPSRVSNAQEHDPESPPLGKRPGPWPPRALGIESGGNDHNPKDMGNWARRTGFKTTVSTESFVSSPNTSKEIGNAATFKATTLSNGMDDTTQKIKKPSQVQKPELAPPDALPTASTPFPIAVPAEKKALNADKNNGVLPSNSRPKPEPVRVNRDRDPEQDLVSEDAEEMMAKQSHLKYDIRETPGIVSLILYALQHYISIIGSLILIPLVIVPAMHGSDEDTAKVVSTVLLISGISTLLHSFFGSRLPLVQGASFVYLAPALSIIFSNEFSAMSKNRFQHTMRELQGAMIIGSVFQFILGYSGLMSVFLRVINPVVVASTVAAVGLAFFTYGFAVVGTCVEIGLPQILIIVLFSLYLRRVSIFGNRVFQVYAVPLGLAITWAYAFLLTEVGVYNFRGCNMKEAISSIKNERCRKHVYTMQHCRSDVSDVLKTVAWVRVPYPFQWGVPTFHFKTAAVMIVATIIASVDSVGTYHGTSLLVASKAPTPGVVSRGIGLEGLTSLLAGIWGTGTGMTTLTENVHTVAVTKIGSRRAVEFGAYVLIALSFVGKVGGFVASMPKVIVAGLLCYMWTMLVALGLSTLRYSATGSSRNMLIVGLSLFLSLSIPSYFQQYGRGHSTNLEKQFQPYMVGAKGPIQTGAYGLDFFLNTVFSLHMVIAFAVALILDNTVPGSRQEKGAYSWSRSSGARNEPAVVKDYGLPFGLSRYFLWARWVGL